MLCSIVNINNASQAFNSDQRLDDYFNFITLLYFTLLLYFSWSFGLFSFPALKNEYFDKRV